MHGSQYAGPRRPNPAQHMPNQPGPRQMPYRGPPQGPPRGAPHGPPGPQRSQRPAPGVTFNNFQGPHQQHPQGPPPTRNGSEPYQNHGQPPTQVIRGARGGTAPSPPNNALKAAPGSMQQSSTPLYVSPVRTDLQGQPQQSPPSLSENHLAESQPSPVGFISEWPLAQNQNGYASTDTSSPSVKPDEGSHSRSHGSYASSAVVPEVWNKELVPALAESTAATQKSGSASLSAASGKTSNIQAHGNETANPPTASPGETLKASATTNSPETRSSSQPESKLVPESPAVSVSQTAVPKSTDTRASVSSLSDLILRATKLATFIDKNQRPVSKMAPLAEFNNAGEKSIEVHEKISRKLFVARFVTFTNSITQMTDKAPTFRTCWLRSRRSIPSIIHPIRPVHPGFSACLGIFVPIYNSLAMPRQICQPLRRAGGAAVCQFGRSSS